MTVLRDYQATDVARLRTSAMRSGSVLYQAATGTGKTVVAADIARRVFDKGARAMLLVHRQELVDQAIATLARACPEITVGVEAAGYPSMPWAQLQVGSVQSVVRRKHIATPDIVIVDECHHARAKTWETVLGRWPDAIRIGLTATPQRLDGKGLGEHFAEMVEGPPIPDLIADGHLAPMRTLTLPAVIKQEEEVNGRVIASAADAYLDHAAGKRAIFFGMTIEHSKQVCAELRRRGVRAAHVDGKDSRARRFRILNEFRTGGVDVVGNCNLISEGYDAPACEVVILGRPTKSVVVYLQQAGRAARPGPGKVALIVDTVGIVYDLGLPDEARYWSLQDGELADRREGKKRELRECGKCLTLFYGLRCTQCQAEGGSPIRQERVRLVEAPKTGSGRPPRSKLYAELRVAKTAPDRRGALVAIARDHRLPATWVDHVLTAWQVAS